MIYVLAAVLYIIGYWLTRAFVEWVGDPENLVVDLLYTWPAIVWLTIFTCIAGALGREGY